VPPSHERIFLSVFGTQWQCRGRGDTYAHASDFVCSVQLGVGTINGPLVLGAYFMWNDELNTFGDIIILNLKGHFFLPQVCC
jgi:hypothetical protein